MKRNKFAIELMAALSTLLACTLTAQEVAIAAIKHDQTPTAATDTEMPPATSRGDWFFAMAKVEDFRTVTLKYRYQYCSRTKPLKKSINIDFDRVTGNLFHKSGEQIPCKEVAYLSTANRSFKKIIVLKNKAKLEEVSKVEGDHELILILPEEPGTVDKTQEQKEN